MTSADETYAGACKILTPTVYIHRNLGNKITYL